MNKVQKRVQRIHTPVLPGSPLLLMPLGLLVRWPVRASISMPNVGDPFEGAVVTVPHHLWDTVITLLLGRLPLERCDAAKRLNENKTWRKTILLRIFSRSYVQQLLASAERIKPEVREQIVTKGERVSIRRLTQSAYARSPNSSRPARFRRTRKSDEKPPCSK